MARKGANHNRAYERPETINGIKFIRMKTGRLVSMWDLMRLIDAAHSDFSRSVSRMFKVVSDDYDMEWLERQLESMEDYIAAVREEIAKQRKAWGKQERIKKLRNVQGRTPEEAAAFIQKADELERKAS
jgi:hypothetical protein